jgi:hypothetical protein
VKKAIINAIQVAPLLLVITPTTEPKSNLLRNNQTQLLVMSPITELKSICSETSDTPLLAFSPTTAENAYVCYNYTPSRMPGPQLNFDNGEKSNHQRHTGRSAVVGDNTNNGTKIQFVTKQSDTVVGNVTNNGTKIHLF